MLDSTNHRNTKIMLIRAKHLFIDHSYQRDPAERRSWLKTVIAQNFKPTLLQTIEVSDRGNNTYAILDGGGRWYAVHTLLDKPEYKLQCNVHTGLALKEEARLFIELNVRRKNPVAKHKFRAYVTEGNLLATGINDIATHFNLKVGKPWPKGLTSMAFTIGLYRLDILTPTLALAKDAWPTIKVNSVVLSAVGMLLKAYPTINVERLGRILTDKGPLEIESETKMAASGNRRLHPDAYVNAIAKQIVRSYNHRTSINRLDADDIDPVHEAYLKFTQESFDKELASRHRH